MVCEVLWSITPCSLLPDSLEMSKKVSDTNFYCDRDMIGGHCTTAVICNLTLYPVKRNAVRYSFSKFLLLSLTLKGSGHKLSCP
jgi:hypothetical protein